MSESVHSIHTSNITHFDIFNFKNVLRYLETCEKITGESDHIKGTVIIQHLIKSKYFTQEKAERMIISMQRRQIIYEPSNSHFRLVD